jgi:pilus assembly protein CpaB
MAIENKKQIFLIAFAVVAGIVATMLTSNYVTTSIEQKTQELHDQYEQQQKQIIGEMQHRSEEQTAILRQEIAQVRQESAAAVQKASEDASKAQQVASQQAAALAAQQALSATKIKRSSTFLTTKTPPGKRAVTVMVDSLNAVGGLLNPGDFVDVIAHLDIPQVAQTADAEKKKTITAMVFQDLQVLAINANLDDPGAYEDQQSVPSLKVTFAVDAQEAGLLAFANKNGKIELALRAPNENDKETVKPSTWKTLADYVLQNQGSALDVPNEASSTTPTTKEEPAKPYIQIFRGGKEL